MSFTPATDSATVTDITKAYDLHHNEGAAEQIYPRGILSI